MGPGTMLVVDGREVATLEDPHGAAGRTKGLLGRDGIEGAIWLAPAKQVHSFGMRFDLDIAFVARDGTVLRVQPLPRNRITRIVWRARGIVEAERGRLQAWGVRPGSRIDVPGGARPLDG